MNNEERIAAMQAYNATQPPKKPLDPHRVWDGLEIEASTLNIGVMQFHDILGELENVDPLAITEAAKLKTQMRALLRQFQKIKSLLPNH